MNSYSRERFNIEIATEKILRQAVYLLDGICAYWREYRYGIN